MRLTNDQTKLFEQYNHYYHVNPFNVSPSFLAKNNLATYFEKKKFTQDLPEKEKVQKECMDLVYELVTSFAELECLIAKPCSTTQAKKTIEDAITRWQDAFLKKIDDLKKDERSTRLAEKLSSKIQKNTKEFLKGLNDPQNPTTKNTFTANDVSNKKSLGHLIATNLDLVLNTSTKLAYHHSPYSTLNLVQVDNGIEGLSDAKKDFHRQNYSLQRTWKIHPSMPYPPEMLARVNPQRSDYQQFDYTMPHHNPSAAERMTRRAFNKNKGQLYASGWIITLLKFILSVFDFVVFLPCVVLNLTIYLLFNICNIISFKYYSHSFDKAYQRIQFGFIAFYTALSLLDRFQAHENHLIKNHWVQNELDTDYLEKSIIKKTHTQEMLESLHFPKPKSVIQALPWNDVKKHLQDMPLTIPALNQTNVMRYHSENQFNSGMTKIGDIISLLIYSGIDPFFRKSPLIATVGFMTSLLTLSAFISPSLIIPGTKFVISLTQQWTNQISTAFCGTPANAGIADELVGLCFFWQIAGTTSGILISMRQEPLGWSEDMKHKIPEYLNKFGILALSAYGAGFLPPITIFWDKISQYPLLNKSAELIFEPCIDSFNFLNYEVKTCLKTHPISPFALFTLALMAGKGAVVGSGWTQGNKIVHLKALEDIQAENTTKDTAFTIINQPIFDDEDVTSEDNNLPPTNQDNADLTLRQCLDALTRRDKTLLEQSQHASVAHPFYLELKNAIDTYNTEHPEQKIDGKALLDCYFNLYCQSNTCINYLKLVIIPYVLWSLLEFAALYATSSNSDERAIYTLRFKKHLQSALLICIQNTYYALHMLGSFIKVVWNYVVIGIIRSVITVFGEACMLIESLFTNKTLKTTKSYLTLCEIDDMIAEAKIRHHVHSCLSPIFKWTSSLAQSTGIFENIDLLAKNLLEQLDASEQETPEHLLDCA